MRLKKKNLNSLVIRGRSLLQGSQHGGCPLAQLLPGGQQTWVGDLKIA